MKAFKLACAVGALCASSAAYAQPIAAPGTEGNVVLAGVGDVIATYQGTTAAYTNLLYLENTGQFLFNNQSSAVGSTVNLGSFAPGTELLFRLDVTNTGYSYFTGPGARNPDGSPHARVQSGFGGDPNTTLVSFEDLFNGPFVYNDLSFTFSNTISSPTGVPEPSTWLMLILGFALVGGALRRRNADLAPVPC